MTTIDTEPTLLDALLAAPGVYWGVGEGEESGDFVARLEAVAALDGQCVRMRYEAWSEAQGLQHSEESLLGPHPEGGLLLTMVISERMGTLSFRSEDGVHFELQAPVEMKIVAERPEEAALEYAWVWAYPGQPASEKSRARLRRVSR